ncbi:hypothetical protein B5T_01207 [Alloalcanivorax dieselolei B5]|uniref:YobI-like P-loop NTPase domain-containing protein n=1 Tax=Alcanivorax dieselolei (strain DSM 16502 / CGMCC 1.3690 / MCCC 1A00001 / B-5) TaxID=930169 RepID=K0CAG3_ALCDB|nr:hypothetical protein [Alloalcanivorax dieselolei]AFT69490.1 hypothetical protein B5T_01207 [Alloalcanivorax dieselolei B5]GGK10896.1 putative membrane protein YobI [Alloalcanivorax dieselolei]
MSREDRASLGGAPRLMSITRRFLGKSDRQECTSEGSWNLVPLTPEYIDREHGGYVRAIEVALENKQIRNIALSGNYGVGKSSILREFARRQREHVVELSLSTLAPIEASNLDDSVPKQATTPTNRIQQEIVKQLLYRKDPSKAPASRFRRIERFRWGWEIAAAALSGLAIAFIFLLTGWATRIASAFGVTDKIGIWIHLIIFLVATGATVLLRWLFYGKLHIKQLSAGSATVTLDDKSVSYFDQYLDEIVYFFEVSDHHIVIFEDIDRFNDSQIFETLRALNTLLNASPQIKIPIRFIYAIKDSIFDSMGLGVEGRKGESNAQSTDDPAQAEAVRANRTKFFDLIIPVVPFITHRSARNLAVKLLGEIEHEVNPKLLDLAAQYVPDMRLLKNTCNEFIIFRDRIFSGDGEQLRLNETELFAMMLYKSTHLSDFEKIRLGRSNLDRLYKISRELVTENIKRIEAERRSLRQRLARIDGAATRSAQLGDRLIAYVQRTAKAVPDISQDGNFVFKGVHRSTPDVKAAAFWNDFVAEDGDAELHWQTQRAHRPFSLSFSRKNLAEDLGDPLDADSWNEADREELTEQIDEKAKDIKFLRSADFGDLTERSKFLVSYEEGEPQFLEAIAKMILKSGLAYQLIHAGYINRNFTLYTSTFHGDRVGPAATNFIIHHVEQDLMDEHFQLSPDDVDAVLRERGNGALKEPALYNIAILDRLLSTDISTADIMIRSLVDFGDSQARFIQAYLSAGGERTRFIERFTATSPKAFIYLVSQAELDDPLRLDLVNVALAHLISMKQRIDAEVSGYLSAHYADFKVLTSDTTTVAQAERIGAIYADSRIAVPHLEPLGHRVCTSFVSKNLYEITHNNLVIAIGSTETLALDVIRTANETVYDYVLGNLSAYLDAIDGVSATVDMRENFLAIIEDIIGQGASALDDVIALSAPDCKVEDLVEVSEAAWPALAEHGRFPATFNNVSRYVLVFESIDASLAKVLSAAGKITKIDAAEEEHKIQLAVAVLESKDHLPSPALRAGLVESLDLKEYLGVDGIAAEMGELFALLIKHDIIADDAVSYDHLVTTDWATREAFIRESKNFKSYMTPELLGSDLEGLLTSDEVDSAIKSAIVEQAEAYVDVGGPRGLNELARFATRHGNELSPDVLEKMAQGSVSAQQIVTLLKPHLASINRDQLFTILRALGGDYPKLSEVGRDKPRIPNTVADRALLERLKQDGIVSRFDEQKSPIKVHKRYK